MQINVPGDQLFQPVGQSGTSTDIFHVISALRDTIANNNQPPPGSDDTKSNQNLRDALAAIRERITTQQTFVGGIGQRLDDTKARLKEVQINLTDSQEAAQGVDITKLATQISTEQNAYDALLTIHSRIIQQSLIDYIK